MVELERAVTAWQHEGTPEAQGAVIWRAAQVLWEAAAIFKRHSGSAIAPLGLLSALAYQARWLVQAPPYQAQRVTERSKCQVLSYAMVSFPQRMVFQGKVFKQRAF